MALRHSRPVVLCLMLVCSHIALAVKNVLCEHTELMFDRKPNASKSQGRHRGASQHYSNATSGNALASQHYGNATSGNDEHLRPYLVSLLSRATQHLDAAVRAQGSSGKFMLLAVVGFVLAAFGSLQKCCGGKFCNVRSIAWVREFLRAQGIDKFGDFLLHFTVHEVHLHGTFGGGLGTGMPFVQLTCGNDKVSVPIAKIETKSDREPLKYPFNQNLVSENAVSISVKQGVKTFRACFMSSKKQVLAEMNEDIWEYFLEGKAHAQSGIWITLKRTAKGKTALGEVDPKICVTYLVEDGSDQGSGSDGESGDGKEDAKAFKVQTENLSQTMKAQLAQAQAEISSQKVEVQQIEVAHEQDHVVADGHQQLQMLSSTLTGVLKMPGGMMSTLTAYKIRVTFDDSEISKEDKESDKFWYFRCWSLRWYKEGAGPKDEPKGVISMMKILHVLPDPKQSSDFVIRYTPEPRESGTKVPPKDLRLVVTDDKRDVWIEAFHLFIDQLHARLASLKKASKKPKVSKKA